MDSAVRRPMLRIGKRREEYFAVAQDALLKAEIYRQSRRKAAISLGNGKRAVCRQERKVSLTASLPNSRVHVEAILVRDPSTKFIALVRRN